MDYRDLIRAEFLKRRTKEPFYSLRQFAKELELSPMHLSYLLRGKRGLSKKNARRVAYRIGLITFAAQRFMFLASAQSGRSKGERHSARSGLQRKWIAEADKVLSHKLKEFGADSFKVR